MKCLVKAFLLIGYIVLQTMPCRAGDIIVPRVQQGVLDLRQQDLSLSSISLEGDWGFYWKQLLSPTDSLKGKPPAYVLCPSLWAAGRINGQPLPSQGYATYTLTILLPKKRSRLALEVPDMYCAYRLYVNGTLLAQNGNPDTSAANATPFWTTQIVPISSRYDTVQLLMQASNYWHSKGGTYRPLLIGKRDDLYLAYQQHTAMDWLLAGCLFMGGLFFFGFFVFGKRDKALLYFSVFCIVYSYRIIGTDLYVLHATYPYLSWFLTIRLEYLALTVSVGLFTRYVQNLYPQDTNKYAAVSMVGFCLLYSLIILVTPPIIFTRLLNIFLVVMFFCIAYVFFISIRAVRFKRVGAVFALMSCGMLLLVFLLTNLQYFGFVGAPKIVLVSGYILFFFLQSLALSHRFASAWQRAAEEARQGLKTKSEFLSTMSHEIRTPLNVVIGLTHLMLKNKPRKDQQENLDLLLFSANNLLSLVNDILDYNKIEAGKISFEYISMDLSSIGRNIIGGLSNKATEQHITLQLQADAELQHKVIGDPTRTSQVIYNLVHNGIKFTKEGSVVLALRVENKTATHVTVRISVTDTGIGIDPEKQQLIFERFTQADSSTSRSYGGTGLGLTITKRILLLQDVELQLISEPGKGSTFFYIQTFPLSNEPVSEAEKAPTEQSTDTRRLEGCSLLLVEDNPFNVLIAQSLLEREGAIVTVAQNGQEALDAVTPGKFQLILMDLNMPVMDGFEASRRLRQRGETLPIIALTASLEAEVEQDVKGAGISGFVLKPFNPDDLFRTILLHVPPVPH